jgi:hypothetical protein
VLPRRLQQAGADVNARRVVMALAAIAAAAASTAAAVPLQVTMVARPTVLGAYQRATLFGSVDSRTANEIVTIQGKDCGSSAPSFRDVAEVRTREGGGWSTEFDPLVNTTLRAVWRGNASTEVRLRQRAAVILTPRREAGSGSGSVAKCRSSESAFFSNALIAVSAHGRPSSRSC